MLIGSLQRRFGSPVHCSACSEFESLLRAMTCSQSQHRLVSKQYYHVCISQQLFTAVQPAEPVILHIRPDLTELCSTQLVLLEAAKTALQAQIP